MSAILNFISRTQYMLWECTYWQTDTDYAKLEELGDMEEHIFLIPGLLIKHLSRLNGLCLSSFLLLGLRAFSFFVISFTAMFIRAHHLALQPYFLNMNSNIILPHVPRSPKWYLPAGFLTFCMHFSSPSACKCPTHLILFYLVTIMIFIDEYELLSSSLHSFLYTSHLGPHILLCTLFPDTLDLCFPLKVRNHLSHIYERQVKLVVYILIFWFLYRRQEDKRSLTEW